ncbi:MAG: hypothetical protein LBF16_06465, partial [Pseudomonadales bacterium]|nr:hypothetical protein [Pseudomonadales bacterium]
MAALIGALAALPLTLAQAQIYPVPESGVFTAAGVLVAPANGDTIELQGATATMDVTITLPTAGTGTLNFANTFGAASTVVINPTFHFSNATANPVTLNFTGDAITFNGSGTAFTGTGGFLSSAGAVTLNVLGSGLTLSNHRATTSGGAIYSTGAVTITGSSTTPGALNINNNYAGATATANGGSGIFTSSGSITIGGKFSSITVDGNSALSQGGAFHQGGTGGSLSITADVTGGEIAFTNNTNGVSGTTGLSGGAIYSDGVTTINAKADKLTFFNNTTLSQNGGGIGSVGAISLLGTYGDILFDKNTAAGGGGALMSAASVTIGNSANAAALTTGTLTFSNNKANGSGA